MSNPTCGGPTTSRSPIIRSNASTPSTAFYQGDVGGVIDVGAGDGRVLHHLLRRRDRLEAVAAERSLTALSHVNGPQRVQSSIDRLPLRIAPLMRSSAAKCSSTFPTRCSGPVSWSWAGSPHDTSCSPCRTVRSGVEPTSTVRPAAAGTTASDTCGRSGGGTSTGSSGFSLASVVETGPRQPIYQGLSNPHGAPGLLPVLGSPTCPQCEAVYLPHRQGPGQGHPGGDGRGRRSTRTEAHGAQAAAALLALPRFTRHDVS